MLLVLPRRSVVLTASPGPGIPVGITTGCMAAGSRGGADAVPHALDNSAPVKLDEDADHLPHRRAHWVVRVVLHNFASVGGEHLAALTPDQGEARLLHGKQS